MRVESAGASARGSSVGEWSRRYPRPASLPDEVVGLTGARRDADETIEVDVLVPVTYSYSEVLEVKGDVVAWTKRAVLVRVVLQPGHAPTHVWVWGNAVRRT